MFHISAPLFYVYMFHISQSLPLLHICFYCIGLFHISLSLFFYNCVIDPQCYCYSITVIYISNTDTVTSITVSFTVSYTHPLLLLPTRVMYPLHCCCILVSHTPIIAVLIYLLNISSSPLLYSYVIYHPPMLYFINCFLESHHC